MAFINPVRQIERVRVLGIRAAEQTKVLATYNSTIYSILILYSNGMKEIKECNLKEMEKYVNFIAI